MSPSRAGSSQSSSWLEPELELKDFQLGSARLVTFSLQLEIENWPKKAKILILIIIFIYVAKS